MWEIARLILMFLKHNWSNNHLTFGPSKCSLESSSKGVTPHPAKWARNAESSAPAWSYWMCILTGWPDSAWLSDFLRRLAADPVGNSNSLTLVFGFEHLIMYLALRLGSFTCMSPFNPQNHPLKEVLLEAQKSCHPAYRKCHYKKLFSGVCISYTWVRKMEAWECHGGLVKPSVVPTLCLSDPGLPCFLAVEARLPASGHSASSCSLVWRAREEVTSDTSPLQAGFLKPPVQKKFRDLDKRISQELLTPK